MHWRLLEFSVVRLSSCVVLILSFHIAGVSDWKCTQVHPRHKDWACGHWPWREFTKGFILRSLNSGQISFMFCDVTHCNHDMSVAQCHHFYMFTRGPKWPETPASLAPASEWFRLVNGFTLTVCVFGAAFLLFRCVHVSRYLNMSVWRHPSVGRPGR